MRKLQKGNAPNFLTEELQNKLGELYKSNRESKGKSHKFNYWHLAEYEINGQTLYQKILEAFRIMSKRHCFYCDGFPPKRGDETIDHFKPKSKSAFYLDVCRWENLYYACNHCKISKRTQYNQLLLRPDEIEYNFLKYFEYDYIENEILVSRTADELSKQRAKETIRIFDFNNFGQKVSRNIYRIIYEKNPDHPIDDLGFRYLFD